MLLTIRTLSCPPPDNPQSIQAQFSSTGGRIGRSPPCTLILPDPNRHISREHAEIRFRDNGFSIKVVSKVNSVMVNDAVVSPGEAVQLNDGDQILIGEYLLRADISGAAAAERPAPALFDVPAQAPVSANPFDVFDNLAPARAPASLPEPAPDWFRSPAAQPPAPTRAVGGAGLDEFFNPGAEGSKFSDVLTSTPPPAAPDVFAPPPAAAPMDNRLDQFLGLSGDPLSLDTGADLTRGSDLYRASPLDLPLHAAGRPAMPPPPAAPAPSVFPGHDDIFKALEQDFGALSAPPAAAPAQPMPSPVIPPVVMPPAVMPPPVMPPPVMPPAPAAFAPAPTPAAFAPPAAAPVAFPPPVVPAFPPAVAPAALSPLAEPAVEARPVAAVPLVPPAFPDIPAPSPLAAVPMAEPGDEAPTLNIRASGDVPLPVLPATAPVVPMPTPTTAAGAQGADVERLMQVLAESLGLAPGDIDRANPEQTIRLVGELLRMSTDGLFRMLEMRSQLKSELHIEDRTMIASRENNPLKHADTARDAIAYLVDLRQHGNKLFMPPGKAVEDTIWDICAHEMAVMAGTRAALLAALRMFSPEVIEGRIKKTGALENVLPALHKSRLWERFLGMYAELQHEAEDHFDRLLNQEFSKAYSEQSKKLKKKR